jgi:hypothetical protein
MVIVGVSRNTPFRLAGERPPPLLNSLSPYTASLVVRTREPAVSALDSVSRLLDRTVPGVIGGSFIVAERWRNATFLARAGAALLSWLAGAGLLVASIGLFALVLCNVARRTREAAIRMALGATRAHISRLMVKEHMALVAWGCVAGVFAIPVVTSLLAGFLIDEASAKTPWLFVAATGAVLLCTGGLSWVASRKLSGVEPSTALRSE